MCVRAGGPVLELGCGTGRVLLPLAQAGARITGLDISQAMLARARAKVAAAGVSDRVSLIEADFRDFVLSESFRLAFVALNTFMHLTNPGDQARALAAIHRHLVPGGLLVLDLFNPHPELLENADGRLMHDFTRVGPEHGSISSRFHSQRLDPARQILEITFFYDEQAADGVLRRTTAPFELYYFTRREMELLLQATGYDVENVYGSYDLDGYWAGSPKLLFVARRRRG